MDEQARTDEESLTNLCGRRAKRTRLMPALGFRSMNHKALYATLAVTGVCLAGVITVLTWPWDASTPDWWQLEVLARLGFELGTLPTVILDGWWTARENARPWLTAALG